MSTLEVGSQPEGEDESFNLPFGKNPMDFPRLPTTGMVEVDQLNTNDQNVVREK